jgi:hypothetical protein
VFNIRNPLGNDNFEETKRSLFDELKSKKLGELGSQEVSTDLYKTRFND